MENRFNSRDFEQFVKQNADQYRMFPSEKVWNGIHNTLHTRRRWYGIGLAFLLLTTATVTWIMFLNPTSKQERLAGNSIKYTSKQFVQLENKTPEIIIVAEAPKFINRVNPSLVASPGSEQKNLFLADLNSNDLQSIDPIQPSGQNELTENIQPLPQPVSSAALNNSPTIPSKTTSLNAKSTTIASIITKPDKKVTAVSTNNSATHKPNDLIIPVLDSDDVVQKKEQINTETTAPEKFTTSEKEVYPLTIESVTNSYIRLANKRKVSLEIFFLPTISYRKLTENKSFLMNSQTTTPLVNNAVSDGVNSVVTHKPDVGLEAGVKLGLPITNKLKFTAGLQLNVSKYDIKAYPYQREDARIALSNEYGRPSVSTIQTNYRAQESYTKPHWLSNYYVSASLPLGADLQVARLKSGNGFLGIGGTIQPTYTLVDRAYVISTDFKNYAKFPSLTRDWNINSSFEMFAGLAGKKMDWKIGPQVRYQLLSSFYKKYPVKENLINFGLKVAVVLK